MSSCRRPEKIAPAQKSREYRRGMVDAPPSRSLPGRGSSRPCPRLRSPSRRGDAHPRQPPGPKRTKTRDVKEKRTLKTHLQNNRCDHYPNLRNSVSHASLPPARQTVAPLPVITTGVPVPPGLCGLLLPRSPRRYGSPNAAMIAGGTRRGRPVERSTKTHSVRARATSCSSR